MRMVLHAQVNVKSESNFFMGFTENISRIFVSPLSPPDMGEKVELSVAVEGGDPIPLVGMVRWHCTGGTAIHGITSLMRWMTTSGEQLRCCL